MYCNARKRHKCVGNTRLHEEMCSATVQLTFGVWLACFWTIFSSIQWLLCHLCNRNKEVVAKFLECLKNKNKQPKNPAHVPFPNQLNLCKAFLFFFKVFVFRSNVNYFGNCCFCFKWQLPILFHLNYVEIFSLNGNWGAICNWKSAYVINFILKRCCPSFFITDLKKYTSIFLNEHI